MMSSTRTLATILCSTIAAYAAGLPKLSIDDIVTMRKILSVQISPDGKRVAYLIEEPANEANPKLDQWPTSLWIADATEGKPQRLTSMPLAIRSPRWSPDSRRLAFLSLDVSKIDQVFVATKLLEAPRQLTHHPSSVSSLQWSPDSTTIAFLAPATDLTPPEIRKRIDMGFDAMDVEPYQKTEPRSPSRLHVADVSTGREKTIPTGSLHIMSARWSPDGHSFLLTAADQPYPDFEQLRGRLMTVPATGGTPVTYCSTVGKLSDADWLADGRAIAFLGSVHRDTDFYPGGLFVCEGEGSAPRNVTANAHYSLEGFRTANGVLVGAVAENAKRFLASIDLHSGAYQRLTPADQTLQFRTDYSLDGEAKRIACVLARWNQPPDVWVLGASAPRRLTHINPELEHREYGEGREVSWKGKDGLAISGILLLPAGYERGKRYALVTDVHGSNGGEANDFHVASDHWGQLLAANGFAALMVNFRGSVTSGAEFVHAFWGDLGGADLDDVIAGTDAMVQAGIADPDRLGIGGVSYGGYLTACAITKTTKYRAAVMLSGVTNYYSVHTGWSAAPEAAEKNEWGKNPYEAHDLLWDRSPSAHLDRVKTPTLILWGINDPAIPVMQAFELFRGLRHYGVPSKLVVYPREGHVPREVNHLRDLDQRVIEWFRSNLKP